MSIMQEPIRGSCETLEGYETKLAFAKLRAKIILVPTSKIVIPSYDEMIGIYGLERDDELPPRKESK